MIDFTAPLFHIDGTKLALSDMGLELPDGDHLLVRPDGEWFTSEQLCGRHTWPVMRVRANGSVWECDSEMVVVRN